MTSHESHVIKHRRRLEIAKMVMLAMTIVGIIGLGFVGVNLARDVANKNQASQDEQTAKIIESNNKLQELQNQNNALSQQNIELQKLTLCLLQVIKGGSFSNDQECQERIQRGVVGTAIPRPQPQPPPTPQTINANGADGQSDSQGGLGTAIGKVIDGTLDGIRSILNP